jgi:hypothetical protein
MKSNAKIITAVTLFVLVISGLAWLFGEKAHPSYTDTVTQSGDLAIVNSIPPVATTTTTTTTVTTHPKGNPVVAPTSKPSTRLLITSIAPSSGPAGTVVALTGSGFDSTSQVVIGNGAISNGQLNKAGTVLTFTMSNSLGAYCLPRQACPMYALLLKPGTYTLNVRNSDGTNSNGVSYTLTGSENSL